MSEESVRKKIHKLVESEVRKELKDEMDGLPEETVSSIIEGNIETAIDNILFDLEDQIEELEFYKDEDEDEEDGW